MIKKNRVFSGSMLLILTGGLFFQPALLFADVQIRTIEGSVSEVNTRENRIVIHGIPQSNRLGDDALKYEDITLDVSSVLITKGTETKNLNNLQSGDHVTARYDKNAQPLPRAVSIEIS